MKPNNSRVPTLYGVSVNGVPVVGFDYFPFKSVKDRVPYTPLVKAIVKSGKPHEWTGATGADCAYFVAIAVGGEWGRISGNAVIFTNKERPT
jgi:hypothetical protein